MADSFDTPAIPPRYYWLKRLSVAAVALVAGVIGLRLAWGHIAQSRLQREVDRLRTTGQPVTLDEFNEALANIPAEDNAALFYEQAMNALVATASDGSTFDTFMDDDIPNPFVSHAAAARELFEKNAVVRDLVRKARERKQVAWSGGLDPMTIIPSFTPMRMLARSFRFNAAYHLREGNHEEALDTLLDFERFNTVIGMHPSSIASSVARACDGLAIRLIVENAGTLTLGSPITEAGVRELIHEYLDDIKVRTSMARGWRGDAAMLMHRFGQSGAALQAFGFMGAPAGLANIIDVLQEPALTLDALACFQLKYRMATAAHEALFSRDPTSTSPKSIDPDLLDVLAFPMTRAPSQWVGDADQSALRGLFLQLAIRRMAAIALAIRLYEVEYGYRPVSLEELTLEYLSVLPVDPFSTEGAGFHYAHESPLVEGRTFLYSVGPDGVDNGGAPRVGSWVHPGGDISVFLDPEPRPAILVSPQARPQ